MFFTRLNCFLVVFFLQFFTEKTISSENTKSWSRKYFSDDLKIVLYIRIHWKVELNFKILLVFPVKLPKSWRLQIQFRTSYISMIYFKIILLYTFKKTFFCAVYTKSQIYFYYHVALLNRLILFALYIFFRSLNLLFFFTIWLLHI